MLPTDSLVEALGGRKVFKRRIANLDELREAVKAGLPYASLEALIGKLGLGREEAAAALHLPQRTIARRKKESGSRPMNRTGYYGWPESAPRQWPHWEAKKRRLSGCAGPIGRWVTAPPSIFSIAILASDRSKKFWVGSLTAR